MREDAEKRRMRNEEDQKLARMLLGTDDNSGESSDSDSNFMVELSIGWVDRRAVFPMGTSEHSMLNEDARMQPRRTFNRKRLDDLKALMREHRQLAPAWVRKSKRASESDSWELIDGERRWIVAGELESEGDARFSKFLIRVLTADTRTAYRLSVIADVQNEAHSSVERGWSLLQIKQDMEAEIEEELNRVGYDNSTIASETKLDELGAKINTMPPWIREALRHASAKKRRPMARWEDVAFTVGMTDRNARYYVAITKLPAPIVEAIEDGQLSGEHAAALVSLKETALQMKLFRKIVADKLNGRDAQALAREWNASSEAAGQTEAALYLRPLRTFIAQATRVSQIELPEDVSEETKEQGREVAKQLEDIAAQLRQKWG